MAGQDRGGRERSVGTPATFVDHVRPDGSVLRVGSRRHRKHQKPAAGSTWWAPAARGWWIAVLFAVGSLLFGLGAVPGYAGAAGARWDTVTFFAGSLFFTAASFLSYREAVDASPPGLNPAHRRFLICQPRRIDWWATAVQFLGTLYFNVSCGAAMVQNLSAQTAHQHVWRPDAIGSVCFLVSSLLSWYECCHGWAAWRPASWAWWITLANLIGDPGTDHTRTRAERSRAITRAVAQLPRGAQPPSGARPPSGAQLGGPVCDGDRAAAAPLGRPGRPGQPVHHDGRDPGDRGHGRPGSRHHPV